MAEGILNKDREPFGVRAKSFHELKHSRYLLGAEFRKKLPHEPDGLIFQPSLDVMSHHFTK